MEVPHWGSGQNPCMGPEDEVPKSRNSLQTLFTDFDCKNDQNLKISAPKSWPKNRLRHFVYVFMTMHYRTVTMLQRGASFLQVTLNVLNYSLVSINTVAWLVCWYTWVHQASIQYGTMLECPCKTERNCQWTV